MNSVVIIGAGIGGLCTGLGLLLQGYNVSIYEKNNVPGGVLRSISSPDGAFRFEESASIPINPKTYSNYFETLGLDPNQYFTDQNLKTLYNVYFQDKKVLKVPYNINDMRAALQKDFRMDIPGWEKFLYTTNEKYEIAKAYFINKPFIKASSIINFEMFYKLLELNPFTSASRYVKGFIKSKKLRDFILFQAFFMGISLDALPNVYTSVYSSSQFEGIIHIKGGLSNYVQALVKNFKDRGGKIYYNSQVKKILIKDFLVTGIQIGDKKIKADVVVVNADYCYTQKVLINRKLHRYSKSSCSTFIIHLGLTKKYSNLNVHNLFINKNFEMEISNIFKGKLPKNPSLYIYSPSCVDDSFCKNPSHSVINIMVRVPNLKDLPISWNQNTKEELYVLAMKALSTIKGIEDIKDHIVYKSFTTPIDFLNRYNCRYGSCFGIGHTLFQSIMLRPQLRDKKYKNLYYVGSSIHPGNGVSIVIGGSIMVKDAICKNHPIWYAFMLIN